MRVRGYMRACVRDVFSIYDNDILPRLIMIIIKIGILYFIQIRHTDDLSLTDTRLVFYNFSLSMLVFANCRSQFLLDHLGRWL